MHLNCCWHVYVAPVVSGTINVASHHVLCLLHYLVQYSISAVARFGDRGACLSLPAGWKNRHGHRVRWMSTSRKKKQFISDDFQNEDTSFSIHPLTTAVPKGLRGLTALHKLSRPTCRWFIPGPSVPPLKGLHSSMLQN